MISIADQKCANMNTANRAHDFKPALEMTLRAHGHPRISIIKNMMLLDQFIMGRIDPHADAEAVGAIRSWCMAHAKINGATSPREALSWVRGRVIDENEWEYEKSDLEFLWSNIKNFGNPNEGW